MKQFYTFLAAVLLTVTTVAQVGINTDNPYPLAALDIVSTTGGLLVPRMTKAQRNQINVNDPAFPADGLMIYQTDGTAGFYYYNGSSWATLGSANSPSYSIGDVVNGGVVFWVDPLDNRHGLIVAMSDFHNGDGDNEATVDNTVNLVQWGCIGTDLPNVPNVPTFPPVGQGAEIGHGFSNTNVILNDIINVTGCSTVPAASAARDSGLDWFLPSINELKKIHDNKITLEDVDGFTDFSAYYWSSTENGANGAWEQRFDGGNQNATSKDNTAYVRAVRAF